MNLPSICKPLTILISLLLWPTLPYAQKGSVEGFITSDRSAVAGATVQIKTLEKATYTDRDGYFQITEVPPGTYEIIVNSLGFQEYIQSITVDPEEKLSLSVELKPTTEALDEVVVTGTMRRTTTKDSPVKVNVMKSESLMRGRVSSNVMELINNFNGIFTQLNCAVCGTNAIRINGVEGPNTAVLIDGMPIMGALASVYGLNGISPSIIDRIEVIKGPQSTLYGTQALGGVVNIITKNPSVTPTFTASMYGKSTEEGNISLSVSPELGRFDGFVSGDALRLQNFFDNNGDDFNDIVKQSRYSMFGKGTLWGLNGEQRLNIAAKYLDETRTGGLEEFSNDLRGSDRIYGESIFTRRAELLTEYRPLGFNESLRFHAAYTYHDQDSFYGTEHYVAQQNIFFGKVTWNHPVGNRFDLLTGSTVRYETYNDNTPATLRGAEKRWIPGVFSQVEARFGELSLLTGLRVDHHSEHGFVTAPRLSAKYSPGDFTTLRLSGGTGFRVVNVFTEDHAALTGSREVVFNEDLDPEQSRSITAGIEHTIAFGTNPLTIVADGFYTHFSNQILPDYDQDPNLIVYENLDGFSVTRGFSIELEQNFTSIPINYSVGFTLLDVYTNEDGQRKALAYAPDYLGTFGATYTISPIDLALEYNGNLVGPKRMPDNYIDFGRDRWSPAHTTHDIRISRELSNVNGRAGVGLEIYASVENLFNFTQGSPLIDARNPFGANFDTIYTWGPIIGRTASFGILLNLR